ncbi:MAG: hypothetical protein ACKOPM_12975 [Novosphingobium sp.]
MAPIFSSGSWPKNRSPQVSGQFDVTEAIRLIERERIAFLPGPSGIWPLS